MTKQAETPLSGDSSTPMNTTICGQCKSEANPFLHYIKHRGIFRRLCTFCILRFNSQSFCPSCFVLYNPTSPLQDSTTPCVKCHSLSHTTCIGSNPNGNFSNLGNLGNSSGGYVCGLCCGVPVFGGNGGDGIDRKSAAALLAAAKISYESMSKARVVARGEAEKRAKEAWSTRKRAREAIEHVASVEEKMRKESRGLVELGGLGRIVGNVGERNLFGDGSRMDRVDNSSAVLASLNAVELNDKEKVQGGKGNVMLGVGLGGIGENGGVGGSAGDGFGRQMVPVIDAKPVAVLGPYVQNNRPRDGNGGSYQ